MRISVLIFVVLLSSCSTTQNMVINPSISKINKIVETKNLDYSSSLNQDVERSFYSKKRNSFHAKVSFNQSKVLVYLVGKYSNDKISEFSAYIFDSRFHPHTTELKMKVINPSVKSKGDVKWLSAKLIAKMKGSKTNYLQITDIIDLNLVILNKQNFSDMMKNENLYIKDRLSKNFIVFLN